MEKLSNKFQHKLIQHKQTIVKMGRIEDRNFIQVVEKRAKELSLHCSNYKCQKCGATENLTYHHLIMRKAKEYMDFTRYASQRYYWGNIIILCVKCHKNYHDMVDNDSDKYGVISEKEINRVKKLFEDEDEL